MSASLWGGADRKPLRIAIAAAAVHDVAMLAWFTRTTLPTTHLRADPLPWLRWLADAPVAHLGLAALTVVFLGLFAFGRRNLLTGTIALLGLALLYETNAVATGNLMPEWHLSGSCLLGWLAGLAYARGLYPRGTLPPEPFHRLAERVAEAGAVAGIAYDYTASVISKSLVSGLAWDERPIWHMVYGFRAVGSHSPFTAAADAVLASPWLARALATGTLLIQASTILLLVNKRLRMIVGLSLVAMHLGMLASATVMNPQLTVIALVFCLPWPALRKGGTPPLVEPPEPRPEDVKKARQIAMLVAVVLAVLAWTLPLRERLAPRHDMNVTPWNLDAKVAPLPPVEVLQPPAGPDELALLAPLRPGARLAGREVLAIDALRAGGITVTVAGAQGPVRLVLHRAGGIVVAPVQVRDLAVFYQGGGADGYTLAQALGAVLTAHPEAPVPAGLTPLQGMGDGKGP
jgi:hypothetical protein